MRNKLAWFLLALVVAVIAVATAAKLESRPKRIDPLRFETLKRLNAEIKLVEAQARPLIEQQNAIMKEECAPITVEKCQISPDGLITERDSK